MEGTPKVKCVIKVSKGYVLNFKALLLTYPLVSNGQDKRLLKVLIHQ